MARNPGKTRLPRKEQGRDRPALQGRIAPQSGPLHDAGREASSSRPRAGRRAVCGARCRAGTRRVRGASPAHPPDRLSPARPAAASAGPADRRIAHAPLGAGIVAVHDPGAQAILTPPSSAPRPATSPGGSRHQPRTGFVPHELAVDRTVILPEWHSAIRPPWPARRRGTAPAFRSAPAVSCHPQARGGSGVELSRALAA